MSFNIHILGTSCMVPTKDRNQIGTILEHNGNLFVFDCGEGFQRQLKIMKLPIGKIKKIFISHWHGDHVLGLNGLVQTLSNTQNVEKIQIYGPKNSKKYVKSMLNSTYFEQKIPIEVFEFEPKDNEKIKIIDNLKYEIYCAKLKHSIDCIGYLYKEKDSLNIDKEKLKKYNILENNPILKRIKMNLPIQINDKKILPSQITYKKKGLKISFIFDTRPCQGINLLSSNCDYLVIEATHLFSKHSQKAEETEHMSAKESAEIALENNVKNLILTHFSPRYSNIDLLEDEAKQIFENVILSYDFQTIKLKK